MSVSSIDPLRVPFYYEKKKFRQITLIILMALMVLISLDNRQKTVQVLPDVLEESVEESQLRLNDGDKYFLPDILRRNAISKLFIYK